jgi:hypothetical protein
MMTIQICNNNVSIILVKPTTL